MHLSHNVGVHLVSSKLNDLLQAHMAIIALLESSVISSANRSHLEKVRENLERDIAAMRDTAAEAMTAG